jgi:hypothetical protein
MLNINHHPYCIKTFNEFKLKIWNIPERNGIIEWRCICNILKQYDKWKDVKFRYLMANKYIRKDSLPTEEEMISIMDNIGGDIRSFAKAIAKRITDGRRL